MTLKKKEKNVHPIKTRVLLSPAPKGDDVDCNNLLIIRVRVLLGNSGDVLVERAPRQRAPVR